MKLNCQYIAHAAGVIKDIKYSNSQEALKQSYNFGYKFIEIDISLTNDGQLVLIHDWYKTRKSLFNKKGIISKKYFLQDKMIANLTPMSLDMALKWLESHPEIYFISDAKNTQICKILEYINKFFPQIKNRFIPQIYQFDEYQSVKKLGYHNIILILYKLSNNQQEIIKFAKQHPLVAISLSQKEAQINFAILLQKIPVDIIVYTVNQISEVNSLKKLGINKFFTDILR